MAMLQLPRMLHGSLVAAVLFVSTGVSVSSAFPLPAFMDSPPASALRKDTHASQERRRLVANLMAKAQPRRLDQGDNNNGDDDAWDGFGFDVTEYSVKYRGCSAIKTYSDERAENEESDSILEAKRFVVFRLCQTEYCNKYSLDGCSEDYGEYVLEMGDYLEAMAMYQEERVANFCAYCEECAENEMNNGNNGNDDNNGGRRLDEAGDDAAAAEGDDAAAAEGDDAAAQGDDAAAAAQDDCYDVCYNDYNTLCVQQNNGDDDANGDDGNNAAEEGVQAYFECVQVENENNGNAYYIGPHCASDDFSITIGVYSDEDCSTYIGNQISVYDATGIDLDEYDMSVYYPHECMSCKENEFEYENNQEDNEDADNVNEMCENLYMGSAKCNQNFDTVNADAYYSAQQEANEEQVCNFIDNIKTGKYDEDGEIILDVYSFDLANWKDTDQYVKGYNAAKEEITPVQITFLVIFSVGCVLMTIVACCLHASLSRKGLQWRPRRGKWTNPTDISRQNSGIVMGRSRSGPNGPLV